MGHNIIIAYKQRERAARLRLASDIVEAGQRRGCPLSPGEDGIVVELVKQAQVLEQEIDRLQRDQPCAISSNHDETVDP
jgi:hypothetical protein